jgi:hypothetical protein
MALLLWTTTLETSFLDLKSPPYILPTVYSSAIIYAKPLDTRRSKGGAAMDADSPPKTGAPMLVLAPMLYHPLHHSVPCLE